MTRLVTDAMISAIYDRIEDEELGLVIETNNIKNLRNIFYLYEQKHPEARKLSFATDTDATCVYVMKPTTELLPPEVEI